MADMFIVCGVLYGVDHVQERDTRIRFALDLYKNKLLDVELPFTNPFKYTTSLGYNPRLSVSIRNTLPKSNVKLDKLYLYFYVA